MADKIDLIFPSEEMAKSCKRELERYAKLVSQYELNKRDIHSIASLSKEILDRRSDLKEIWDHLDKENNTILNEVVAIRTRIEETHNIKFPTDLPFINQYDKDHNLDNLTANILDQFNFIIERPAITQENAEHFQDLAEIEASVGAMEEELQASENEYYDHMAAVEANLQNLINPENLLNNPEVQKAYEEVSQADDSVRNMTDDYQKDTFHLEQAKEHLELASQINQQVTGGKYAVQAFKYTYEDAMRAAYAMGDCAEPAQTAAREACRETAENYKKAGSRFTNLLDKAKDVCKSVSRGISYAIYTVLDLNSAWTLSNVFHSATTLWMEGMNESKEKLNALQNGYKEYQKNGNKLSSDYNKTCREFESRISQAKADVAINKGVINLFAPFCETQEDLNKFFGNYQIMMWGLNKNGNIRNPIDAVSIVIGEPTVKVSQRINFAFNNTKLKVANLKADFAEFKADTILAIGFNKDKIVQKLEKKIDALEKTDKELYVAKEAFMKLKNNLLSTKPYEKPEYQINPETKEAIDRLKSIENPSRAEKRELKKLEKEVAKDKAIWSRNEDYKEMMTNASVATPEQIATIDKEIAKIEEKRQGILEKIEKAQDKIERLTGEKTDTPEKTPKTPDLGEVTQDIENEVHELDF